MGITDPAEIPIHMVGTSDLENLRAALESAERVAVDTETWGFGPRFEGHLRVVSIAARTPDDVETAWVVDVRDVDRIALARALSGVPAIGWNANFDARVTDRDLFGPAGVRGIGWWDAMLADACLHQGAVGVSWYHSLAWAAQHYCGITLEGKGTTQTSFAESADLTDEQIRYAAMDAIATLRVEQALIRRIDEAGLARAVELEQRARPFLDLMERCGMPFDAKGWSAHLDEVRASQAEALDRIAELTGGGQPNIFTGMSQPLWNPASPDQLKEQLNRCDSERVRAYFAARDGRERLFTKPDRVDRDTLRELGGDLAEAILEFRDGEKILKTYGDNLTDLLWDDGRFHSQYLQVVGTDTGRLSSRKPNAQNFSPRMKPFFRPSEPGHVFVYADLSQAELRFLAQVSGDEGMRKAFRDGRDIHEATAEKMFDVPMAELHHTDPARYKELRSRGKVLNFSIVYGLGPTALARRLTLGGIPTSKEEAQGLLDSYLAAYPKVAAWLEARDRDIRRLVDNVPAVDVEATLALADGESRPDAEGAVVICADGKPFEFASYTVAGRRRRFQVATDSWMLSLVLMAVQRRHPLTDAIRDEFENSHGVVLSEGSRAQGREALSKVFEDRQLRRAYFDLVRSKVSPDAFGRLASKALADRIGAMGNAYRNAPIQGGVADVALDAYGRLADLVGSERWEVFLPAQTVHDSIVIETCAEDSVDVAVALKSAMEAAMASFCPDVPAVADADIRLSLDDSTVVAVIDHDAGLDEVRDRVCQAVGASRAA